MSAFTGFFNASQIGSSWPAGIEHNPVESTFLYSVSNTWFINPLDHFQIVSIDEAQVPPGNPNTMSLTMPIVDSLPMGSRIFFFYVSQANAGDLLTFQPVFGSGNTVNGNALGFTFTLTGSRQLLFAFALNNNYIIHNAGLNTPAPDPPFVPPCQIMRMTIEQQAFLSTSYLISLQCPGYRHAFPSQSDNWVVENVISGMEGYILPDEAVPGLGAGAYAFRCTEPGYYEFHVVWNGDVTYPFQASALGVRYLGVGIADSTGAQYGVGYTNPMRIASSYGGTSNGGDNDLIQFTGTHTTKLLENDYINFFVGVPRDSENEDAIPTVNWNMYVLVRYLGPGVEPGPTSMFSLRAAPAAGAGAVLETDGIIQESQSAPLAVPIESLTPEEIAALSNPIDKPASVSHVISLQKKQKEGVATGGGGGASSFSSSSSSSLYPPPSSSAPSFTLQDIEQIVGKALKSQSDALKQQQQQQQPQRTAAATAAEVVVSSSSSSSSSSKAPASKKRKTAPPSSEIL